MYYNKFNFIFFICIFLFYNRLGLSSLTHWKYNKISKYSVLFSSDQLFIWYQPWSWLIGANCRWESSFTFQWRTQNYLRILCSYTRDLDILDKIEWIYSFVSSIREKNFLWILFYILFDRTLVRIVISLNQKIKKSCLILLHYIFNHKQEAIIDYISNISVVFGESTNIEICGK